MQKHSGKAEFRERVSKNIDVRPITIVPEIVVADKFQHLKT